MHNFKIKITFLTSTASNNRTLSHFGNSLYVTGGHQYIATHLLLVTQIL